MNTNDIGIIISINERLIFYSHEKLTFRILSRLSDPVRVDGTGAPHCHILSGGA